MRSAVWGSGGVSEIRCKWPDTPGVSLAGKVHDGRNDEGCAAAAEVNDDEVMACSPTLEELAAAWELVRAVGSGSLILPMGCSRR